MRHYSIFYNFILPYILTIVEEQIRKILVRFMWPFNVNLEYSWTVYSLTVSIDVILFIEKFPIRLEKSIFNYPPALFYLCGVRKGPKNQFVALSIGKFFILEFHFSRGEFTWAHFKHILVYILCPLSVWANTMLATSVEFSLFPGGFCSGFCEHNAEFPFLAALVLFTFLLTVKFCLWHKMIFLFAWLETQL